MNSFFVTATDTNAGKTIVTAALIKLLRSKSINVAPYKPVQSGGIEDTIFVLEQNNIAGSPDEFYSYSLKKPCSPHLSAALDNQDISIEKIINDFKRLKEQYEAVVVEGAGGVMVPLGQGKFVLDIITELRLPVILVIANKLGSINQALLTIDKLRSVGCLPALLVFNDSKDCDELILSDNVKTITELSGVLRVIRIPYMQTLNLDLVVEQLAVALRSK